MLLFFRSQLRSQTGGDVPGKLLSRLRVTVKEKVFFPAQKVAL
jgi:hypothetical protein